MPPSSHFLRAINNRRNPQGKQCSWERQGLLGDGSTLTQSCLAVVALWECHLRLPSFWISQPLAVADKTKGLPTESSAGVEYHVLLSSAFLTVVCLVRGWCPSQLPPSGPIQLSGEKGGLQAALVIHFPIEKVAGSRPGISSSCFLGRM